MGDSPPRPPNDNRRPGTSSAAWIGERSALASAATNTGLCTLQIAAGLGFASPALLADGIHSLSDLAADAIVILAGRHAQKAPDDDHAYGHKRFETGATLALGLLLLGVGTGLALSALWKIFYPASALPASGAAIAVAAASLVCKEGLFRYMRSAAKSAGSPLMEANAWHARSDAASSLVVLFGLLASMAGYPMLDPAAAGVVGAMVAWTGARLSWDALHDLMDRTAGPEETQAILQTLLSTPGVLGAHDVKARKMGDLLLVDAHIEVDGSLTVAEGHRIAVEARDRVMQRHRALNLMTHIDPHGE